MNHDPRLTHALDLARRGQRRAAARLLRRLAEAGNADAAFHFGRLLQYGVKEEDSLTAPVWFKRAAEGGSARGALEHGLESAEDIDALSGEAAEWHRKGLAGLERMAGDGDAESQFKLWMVYEYGQGVEEDKDRALGFLQAAAKSGHLEAYFYLGFWFWDLPDRTEAQRRRAIALWRRAAKGGLEDAQYSLGARYATDPDMPINFKESVRFYRMSALNGNAEALYNLGTMYMSGEGVAKNEAAGHALTVEAAERGDVLALSYLAQAYAKGYQGLPINTEEAAYWQDRYDNFDPMA